MSSQPLVSIFVLSYNNAKYIIETLDSVKNQTYANVELIIVDDCSTDNSVDVIEKWLKEFKRPYKFIIHSKNKGVCAACNTALKNTKGEYIVSSASDDVMLPEKTERQLNIFLNADEKVGIVYSDAYFMKEDSSERYGLFIQKCRNDFESLPDGDLFQTLLEGNFIPAMTTMVKRSVYDTVGLYDESLKYEDWDMWLRIAKNYNFIHSDYISAKYRVKNSSLVFTLTNKDWNADNIKILSKHIEAAGVKDKLKTLVNNAYLQSDKKSIQEFRIQNIDRKHSAAIALLRALKVPKFIGVRILRKLK